MSRASAVDRSSAITAQKAKLPDNVPNKADFRINQRSA
jgi:hypothetical protein